MTANPYYPSGQNLFGRPMAATKPRVFVSYHHGRDQAYCDRFQLLFSQSYEIITDTSIDRRIDSENATYQQQVIREKHITGSSVTIVLCGPESWKRRWIDWEIHMTLNKQHGLLGIVLPTAAKNYAGEFIVPDRLLANVNSGFAHWIHWSENAGAIKQAVDTARNTGKIQNSAPRMQRSRS